MRIRYRELECFKKVEKGWINSIPDIWNCANLGYFCEFIMGQAPHSDTYNTIGEGTIFIKAGDFGKKHPKVTNYTINPLVQCKKGDILICVVGATSGKINFAIDGSISRSVAALRVKKELDKRYLYYFLDYSYQNINDLANGSAQGIINKDILKNIVIPLPNKETQQKISNFLDKKTAQFDSIISKKEALIEKLEEAKKSLISEVVTGKVRVVKTDDGYELVERKKEEMKDSGVEWLGDIPMGWNVSKIKHICSINSNVLSENTDEEYEIKYIDIGSVTSDGRIIGLQEYKFKDAPSRARRIVNDKDILISTVRTYLKAITSIEKSDENLICSTGFAVLSPSENIDYKFLSYFIRGNKFIDEVVSRSVGVSYPAITSSEIANLEVIIPSLNEQVKIGNYIDNKINKLNSIISNTQNQIDKIKEAKQSLISDAVTGKIEILD